MPRLVALVLLLPIAIVIGACGGSDDAADSASGGGGIPVYADAGTEIPITAGGRFAIELQANPSTGYRWEVEIPAGVVQESEDTIEPTGQTDEAVGVPVMQRWTFRVDEAKDGVLVFANVPPGSDEAEQTIEFDLVVDAG
jgi:predicted secreted protein